MTPETPRDPKEDPIRHHVFDGIAEYDRRLPNWWLLTFYGAIAFAIVYWFDRQTFGNRNDEDELRRDLARIEAIRLADAGSRDDDTLWKMSRNAAFTNPGSATYKSTCASCHGDSLNGGIGPSLVDNEWLHGNQPLQLITTVEEGVPAKGMPSWGPMLGTKKVNEVVAFILSHHTAPAGAE